MRIWLAFIAAACGPAPERPAERDETVIRIAGSEVMTRALLPKLAERYTSLFAGVSFDIRDSGSGTGFEELLDGDVDLAGSSRVSKPVEQEQARANGWDLEQQRHILAVDVVAVAVHPSRNLDSLTYDQVIGIFCTRSVDNWSFLGLEDAPIKVLAPHQQSGTRALFEDFFCGPRGIHARIPVGTASELSAALTGDPSTITVVSLSSAQGKLLALRPQAEAPPVEPSQKNILRGRYPLYHDLFLYRHPSSAPDVMRFVDWTRSSAGQDVVDEANLVPLFYRPEKADGPRPLRETIHFEAGSDVPNQHSGARLHLLVEELKERGQASRHIILEGYADNQETTPVLLSEKRALVVKDYLEKSLPDSYFEVIPRGASNPIAPNETPFGRLTNRRVQIYLAEEEVLPPPVPREEDPSDEGEG